MDSNIKVLEIYKDYLEKNGRSPATIRLYKTVIQELDRHANEPFKKLTNEDIGRFLKWKKEKKEITGRYAHEEGLTSSSYSMYILVLKIFYR